MTAVPAQEELDRFVRLEVILCVSGLVSTLANNFTGDMRHDLSDLCERASELCYPVEDWQEAAENEGFEVLRNEIVNKGYWWRPRGARGWSPSAVFETAEEAWQDCCEANDIEPAEWEVYEHWAVSDFLADLLEKEGERVDRDFNGLTVWARTTTGQAIAMDDAIKRAYCRWMSEAAAAKQEALRA